jgi:hypothetical protein
MESCPQKLIFLIFVKLNGFAFYLNMNRARGTDQIFFSLRFCAPDWKISPVIGEGEIVCGLPGDGARAVPCNFSKS